MNQLTFDFAPKEKKTYGWICHASYYHDASKCPACHVLENCKIHIRQKKFKLYREMKKGMNSKWHSSSIG